MTSEPQPAPAGGPAPGPQVGADEWVARQAQRRDYLPGWRGDAQQLGDRVGWWPRLGTAAAAAALLPLFGLGGFQLQVGINALLLALLAVGLNVTVGWAGLLDLGYVAFFGFGAYGFALLSSGQIGIERHPPARLPVAAGVIIGAAILGAARRPAVAPADRRLPGHRHAVLRRGVRRVHQQRRAARAGRPQRDRRHRPDPHRRQVHRHRGLPAHHQRGLLLPAAGPAGADDGRAAPARPLAHRAGLAGGPRRPARRRVDDDPGQPGQADGVRPRRR